MKTKAHGGLLGRFAAIAALVAIAGLGGVFTASRLNATPTPVPAYLAAFPDFSPAVTPQMPGDVDVDLKTQLEKAQQFPKVQREFDLYSWQMFLALNWPTNNQGQPAPHLEDTAFGAPHWTLWHNSASIFQVDGAPPTACASPRAAMQLALTRNLTKAVSAGLKPFSVQATASVDPRKTRFLGVISAVGELNVAKFTPENIGQAFSGPMIDQNGEFVYYEIMLDPNEVGYLCGTKLYNINGQVAFSGAGGKVSMPWGSPSQDWSGAFELKFAWKVLTKGKDDFIRFYTTPAVIMDQGPHGEQLERNVTVGLVGMHIGHKTGTSPQWIWSTFEQVDNLSTDQVAHPGLHPNFFDPNCEICTVDQIPVAANGVYPKAPTQAWRAVPIPADKTSLNAQVQAALGKAGSIWQYYQLIDSQWPTNPGAVSAPYTAGLPASIANKPGGNPTPVYLTNITMETYFQAGGEEACNQQEAVPKSLACVSPPSAPSTAAQPVIWTSPLNNGTAPGLPGNHTTVFGSESCMGCHSLAGIYTAYDPKTGKGTTSPHLTADFSWLMSQKAKYYSGTTK